MTDTQLNNYMIADFESTNDDYKRMERYYKGKHDILYNYRKFANRANAVIVDNYVNKFINEEVQYSLGNPVSYVSLSGDKAITDAIYNNTFHWKENHNQELMRTLEIFGTAYTLYYIDKQGRFCERILNPSNSIVYTDTDGVPVRFIHFYKKKYNDTQYKDIYYSDGRIEIYEGSKLIDTKKQPFSGVPVSVCKLENIEDTIYCKIKTLQDAYNQILSDQGNTISEFRNAYLVITGVLVDEESKKMLDSHGLLNLQSNGSVRWLMKDMPDTYINNMLSNLRAAMYANTNHIDGNEKLQSNTSGSALRNRLVFLEQRCNMMLQLVIDTIYERLARLFEYCAIKGTNYNINDIKVVSSPSIPQDEITIVQMLSQLGIGEHISLETALSLLPFIESPAQEIDKIQSEQAKAQEIELDKINDPEF